MRRHSRAACRWSGRARRKRRRFHLDFAAVNAGSPATMAEAGRHLGADGVLIGRASGGGANANVRWIHLFQDRSSEFSGHLGGRESRRRSVCRNVRRQRQSRAGRHRGDRSSTIFAITPACETYLESLTFISHVSVESLSGDTVRFRLATRGGVGFLAARTVAERAFAAGRRRREWNSALPTASLSPWVRLCATSRT